MSLHFDLDMLSLCNPVEANCRKDMVEKLQYCKDHEQVSTNILLPCNRNNYNHCEWMEEENRVEQHLEVQQLEALLTVRLVDSHVSNRARTSEE